MAYFQSIILGIIQGTTEFLPISSSAHLVLVPWIFGWDYNGLGFDTALHFGTAIAIVVFFWRDWVSIIARAISLGNTVTRDPLSEKTENGKRKTENNKFDYPSNLLWQILIASIPAAIAGYFLSDYVETYLHSPILLAINLAVFGIILWLVDKWANQKSLGRHCEKSSTRQSNLSVIPAKAGIHNRLPRPGGLAMAENNRDLALNKINYSQSFIVGLAQTLALVPGVSRSGITMTAGRSLGMSRENSARFSFLLSTPAIIGAFLFEARKVDWTATSFSFWLAIIVTVIVGLLTIKYLLKYLQRGSFAIFTIYRIALAIIIVVLFLTR